MQLTEIKIERETVVATNSILVIKNSAVHWRVSEFHPFDSGDV